MLTIAILLLQQKKLFLNREPDEAITSNLPSQNRPINMIYGFICECLEKCHGKHPLSSFLFSLLAAKTGIFTETNPLA
jgi:hypothetical protein